MQILRRLLGYWLCAVAPLVPLKSLIFQYYTPATATDPAAGKDVSAEASSSMSQPGVQHPALLLCSSPSSITTTTTTRQSTSTSAADTQGPSEPLTTTTGSSPRPDGAITAGAVPAGTVTALAPSAPEDWSTRLVAQLRPLNASSDIFLLATGCLAGFASGLLGIGGGTVVTPLMAVATGLPQVGPSMMP